MGVREIMKKFRVVSILLVVALSFSLLIQPAFTLDPVIILNYGVSGSTQTTTGSITSGSSQLTISSSLDFENGEGITIANAGPLPTIPAPASLTITPTGSSGSTSYSYAVVALDNYGGVTSSTSTSTSTGNTTLSGTNYNALSVGSVSGASRYAWWRTAGGSTQGFIGTSLGLTLNDAGLPVITTPFGVPTSPPSTALGRPVNSTIVSGAGSTVLTLSSSASTSVTGSAVIHNDTLAIQACLSAVPSGSTVQFPNGQYNINAALQIPSNVVINMQKDAIIYLMDNSNTDIFQINDVQDVDIYGGVLNGNSSNQTLQYDQNDFCGIDIINGSSNIKIDDMEITATAAMAIASNPVSDSDVSNITITNCYIHDLGNQVGEGHGIEMANGTTGAVVENNHITNNVAYGLYAIDADNVTFQDNIIRNVQYGIVYESGTVPTSHETDVISKFNSIYNVEDGIHVEYNNAPVYGNTFEDNFIDGFSRHGIYENYSAGDVIDSNRITNNGTGGAVDSINIGLTFNNESVMTIIENNQIWDSAEIGITDNSNSIIKDNQLWNTGAAGSNEIQRGILIENSNNLTIIGNILTNMKLYGMQIDYNDTNIKLENNQVSGDTISAYT